jgi:hypothetical protein
MPLPLAVIMMVLLLAGMVLYIVLVYRSFGRLRRVLIQRGYKSPAVLTLAGGFAFVLPLAATILLASTTGNDNALWVLLASMLVVPAATSLAAPLLPARNPRTSGRRVSRFPYARAGYAMLAASAPLVVVGALAGAELPFRMIPVLITSGVACLAIARRLASPDASTVLAADARPPVLYLRPFHREDAIFIELPRTKREFLLDWGRNLLGRDSKRFMTLEEYLQDEITRSLGPFVALGNPLDFMPPGGAARLYLPDEEWMNRFSEFIEQAACAIMIAGSSEHVLWELQRLKAMGFHQRLFILTKPQVVRKAHSLPAKALRWYVRLFTKPPRKREDRPIPWSAFAEALRQAGYDPGTADPGPGAVVSFDVRGRAVVLRSDAKCAADTIEAIRSWIGCAGNPLPLLQSPFMD